jgi:hypothetical protein
MEEPNLLTGPTVKVTETNEIKDRIIGVTEGNI